METAAKKLERWIRKMAFGDYDDPLARFVIKHSPQGNKGNVIGQKAVEQVSTDDIEEIISDLNQMINDDASGLGGVQRYIIEAFHGERESASARYPVRVQGFDEEIDGSNDAEPPTKGGMIAQLMRHNEVLMKTFANTVGGAVQTLQRSNARQSEHIEHLIERRFQDIAIVEDAMGRKHERELELIREGSSQERRDKVVEKGLMLLPVIANKVAGTKLLPGGMSPRDQMLHDFASSLDPEQFTEMQKLLNPEQLIVLVNLLQSLKAEDDAKKAKESKDAHNASGNGAQ